MKKQKQSASINQKQCVACGTCLKACPKQALSIKNGCYATVEEAKCVGCGRCANVCPASVIHMNHTKKEVV